MKESVLLMVALSAVCLAGCDSGSKTDDKAAPAASAPEAKAAPADTWKDYKIADTGLQVRVPSDPQCQDQDQNGVANHMCAAESDKTGVMISYAKLPAEVDPAKIPEALQKSMEGQAQGMSGTVENPKDIQIGDLKAKDFSVKTAQGEVRGRITIKGAYLVQAIAMAKATPDDTTKSEAEKFVASLAPTK